MFRLEKLEINGFKSFADRTTLLFGEGITGVVGPNGCGKCLSGDSLVTLADGRDVPIRELVESALGNARLVETLDDGSLTRENPQGIKILSLNPTTLRLEPRSVTAFIKREATPHLLRIRTRAGREVTATPYHPLFTLQNGDLRALKAEDVKIGARIALPRRLPAQGSEVGLPPLAVLEQFQSGDNIYIPNSESLRAWADTARKRFGTWTGWADAARVPMARINGLLNDQAISTTAVLSLAQAADVPAPLDGRIKSHGSGQINLPFIFTPDLARFLGLLIAEGRNTSSNQVWFVNSDPAINDDYERLARNLFGVQIRRFHYKAGVEDVLIFSRTLCVALERLFNFPINSNSAEKQVPPQLFEADAQTQWAFLSGLFEGDAYISVQSKDGNPRPPFIEYLTASPKLAQQVIALLLRLGVFATLRPKERFASNTAEKRRRNYYAVMIYGAEQLRRTAERFSFVGEKRNRLEALRQLPPASNPNHDLIPGVTPLVKEAAQVAGVKIKANRQNRAKLAAYAENRCEASRGGLLEVVEQIEQLGTTPELAGEYLSKLTALATSDVYWDEIVSVEQVEPPDEWVYDLSIAETHNFVAGNIIVHNSNVAEAISWVLGEQSAKNLRGGKMEDVIFNGTRDRKPTGMSEVLLTMVAIEDIAARDDESSEKDDEHEYEDAIQSAERAAQTARLLVEENSEQPETDDSGQATAGVEPSIAGDAQLANESPDNGDQPALEEKELPTAQSQLPASKRTYRRRKRATIVISAGERVTVGRRLYRTGDSEYLMNGRACLLRDIQDLFAGTGLGGAQYAIVEQGRIGQILSSKPLDRRALIEEAAGITKFKSRKRAAELRLDSAKQNLTRLNDIISEVERQVNSLKRQAQKARRYRRLREEMRGLLKIVFTADYYRLNEAIERVARELEEVETGKVALDAELRERETEHHVASIEARQAEDNLAGLRERASAVELEADRARNRRAFEQQQIKELASRIEEINRDQQSLEGRLAQLEEVSDERANRVVALESELSGEQSELQTSESQYQEELAQLREAESQIEQLRQRMLTEIGITERLRNLSASLEDAAKKLDLKQANLRAEMERARARHDEAAGARDHAGLEVEQDLARLAELTARIAERAAHIIELRNEVTSLRSEVEEIRAAATAANHRLASLEDLDAHRAYYSDAVQQVLSPEQAARVNALGTLADFVEVEAPYERLIESLFGRELQCMLVPTIDDALAGVEFIKSESLGRGAFLVVGLHGGEGEPEDEGQGSGAGGQSDEQTEPRHSNGIERWLIDSKSAGSASRFQDEYIPIGRQLPPADFAFTEPFAAFPDAGYQMPVGDASLEAEEPETRDETEQYRDERRFDEEDARTASRFQLDVLRAIDLLSLRSEIKSVVERAFPDKCAASIVPDIEAALQLSIENPSLIYVTYEGEQVVNGRLIVTGAQAGQRGASLLGLKREIKQLRVQTEMLAAEQHAVAERLARAESERDGLDAEAAHLDQQLRQHEKVAAARHSQLEGLERDFERAAQHVRVVEAELEQTSSERAEVEQAQEQLLEQTRAAESSRQSVQSALTEQQMALGQLRARAEQLSEKLSSARASVAARAERLHAARAEMRRIEGEAEELRSRINRNRVELYESHSRTEQLALSEAEGSKAAERFEREAAALADQISIASDGLQSSRARADKVETILGDLRQQSEAVRDRRSALEVERARIESEAEHLTRTCFSELAMTLEDVVTSVQISGQRAAGSGQQSETAEISAAEDAQLPANSDEGSQEASSDQQLTTDHCPLPADADSARARLDELRVKLDDMGPVNMMALEELEESEERFKFLTEQRRDILDSIKSTEEALTEIKRRSRERFLHAFTHINQNFQHMFVELFGGGRGEMILIDEDDILESGIDLIAQPPGKRLQNVLLLSGGEKAMAAIALVLAIFQYRPSPFCILDEVDAPLDEVNVSRFSEKVIEMSRDTQFLVITHNKRTMEAARALYGVTMQEPGVSKLVSVKFE